MLRRVLPFTVLVCLLLGGLVLAQVPPTPPAEPNQIEFNSQAKFNLP